VSRRRVHVVVRHRSKGTLSANTSVPSNRWRHTSNGRIALDEVAPAAVEDTNNAWIRATKRCRGAITNRRGIVCKSDVSRTGKSAANRTLSVPDLVGQFPAIDDHAPMTIRRREADTSIPLIPRRRSVVEPREDRPVLLAEPAPGDRRRERSQVREDEVVL